MDPAYQQQSGADIIMQNYEIFLDSEQNIQFMCLQEKPPLIRISPSFCPEIFKTTNPWCLINIEESEGPADQTEQ